MNSTTMISAGTQTAFCTSSSKLNLHSFSSQFPKSTFSLKHFNSKSIRTAPIKAAAAAATSIPDTVYVNTQSFYELLGISETGTLSEIKTAYKKLARKYHPDVSPPDRTEEYTQKFLQVQEAYETLSDPETRALYDRDMSRGFGFHTIFFGRRRSKQEFDGKNEWEDRWESQLSELIRRSNIEDPNNMSWGARMRSRRTCSSSN